MSSDSDTHLHEDAQVHICQQKSQQSLLPYVQPH